MGPPVRGLVHDPLAVYSSRIDYLWTAPKENICPIESTNKQWLKKSGANGHLWKQNSWLLFLRKRMPKTKIIHPISANGISITIPSSLWVLGNLFYYKMYKSGDVRVGAISTPSYSSDLHFSVFQNRLYRGALICSKICSKNLYHFSYFWTNLGPIP